MIYILNRLTLLLYTTYTATFAAPTTTLVLRRLLPDCVFFSFTVGSLCATLYACVLQLLLTCIYVLVAVPLHIYIYRFVIY